MRREVVLLLACLLIAAGCNKHGQGQGPASTAASANSPQALFQLDQKYRAMNCGRSAYAGPDHPVLLKRIKVGTTLQETGFSKDDTDATKISEIESKFGYQPASLRWSSDGLLIVEMIDLGNMRGRYDFYDGTELVSSLDNPGGILTDSCLLTEPGTQLVYEKQIPFSDPVWDKGMAENHSVVLSVGVDGNVSWEFRNDGFTTVLGESLYWSGLLYSIKLNHDEDNAAFFYLYALDENGKERFCTNLPRITTDWDDSPMYWSRPVALDDSTVVCTSSSCLVALSTSGDLLWRATADYSFGRSPVATPSGSVLIWSKRQKGSAKNMVLLRVDSGGETSVFFEPKLGYGPPPTVASDGDVYIINWWTPEGEHSSETKAGKQSAIVCTDQSGTRRWSKPLDGTSPDIRHLLTFTSPAVTVGSRGFVYLADGKKLLSYDPEGNLRWELPLDVQTDLGEMSIGPDGNLYTVYVGEILVVGDE